MGPSRLPRLHNYWSTTPIFCLSWFSTVMSCDRFSISRYLHLVVSSKQEKKRGEKGYDPLFKVRPLIDKTLEIFSKYYLPNRVLAIDEMMAGTLADYSSCSIFLKSQLNGPSKSFVNPESSTGYVLTCDVYTGR